MRATGARTRFVSPISCVYTLKVDRTLAVTSQPPNQR
jgi:hypothetical protein